MPTKSKSLTTIRPRRAGRAPRKLKPVHPGEILREEFMNPLGLSANRLALDLRVPVTRISEIVNERRAISTETALRLACYFNTTPEFWMNLQTQHDLDSAEDRILAEIKRDIRPLKAGVFPDSLSIRKRK